MDLRCVLTVLTEMYISLATSAVRRPEPEPAPPPSRGVMRSFWYPRRYQKLRDSGRTKLQTVRPGRCSRSAAADLLDSGDRALGRLQRRAHRRGAGDRGLDRGPDGLRHLRVVGAVLGGPRPG